MPAKMRKLPHSRFYRVYDDKGHVHAKRTTKENAERQIRLIEGVRHGMIPRKRK